MVTGAKEVGRGLRALAALPKDPSLGSEHQHQEAHNHLSLQLTNTHGMHAHTYTNRGGRKGQSHKGDIKPDYKVEGD